MCVCGLCVYGAGKDRDVYAEKRERMWVWLKCLVIMVMMCVVVFLIFLCVMFKIFYVGFCWNKVLARSSFWRITERFE